MAEQPLSANDEVWKAVPGYEGFYEVSTHGNVQSVIRTNQYRGGQLHPTIGSHGRRVVGLSKGGAKQQYLVYRLVLLTFVGPCPPGMEACHYDGNETNDRLDNLRWDTPLGNAADNRRNGVKVGTPSHKGAAERAAAFAARKAERSARKRGDKTIYRLRHTDGREWSGTRCEARASIGVSRTGFDGLVNGLYRSTAGWFIEGRPPVPQVGMDSPSASTEVLRLEHLDGREFEGTRIEFRQAHGVNRTSICRLFSGKQRTAAGWGIAGTNAHRLTQGARYWRTTA